MKNNEKSIKEKAKAKIKDILDSFRTAIDVYKNLGNNTNIPGDNAAIEKAFSTAYRDAEKSTLVFSQNGETSSSTSTRRPRSTSSKPRSPEHDDRDVDL